MKSNIKNYLDTLQPRNNKIEYLIDINKIFNNIRDIESDLNSLNYLICNDKKEFIKRVNFLFNKNKDCFKNLFLLLAIRYQKKLEFSLNNKVYNINEILNNKEKILEVFFQSGLIEFILKGKVKNFVDYAYGVEVGMDTNARKNRNGFNIESKLYNDLIKLFDNYDFIMVSKQQRISEIDEKKIFDLIIENKKSNKKILIESSFYNSGGSKISETARSYQNLFNHINSYKDNYKFIWLADGYGMSTIKKILEESFDDGYIYNHKMFYEQIKKIVLND